jgi:hypothetical protein
MRPDRIYRRSGILTIFQSKNMTRRQKQRDLSGWKNNIIVGIKAIRCENVNWVHLARETVQW